MTLVVASRQPLQFGERFAHCAVCTDGGWWGEMGRAFPHRESTLGCDSDDKTMKSIKFRQRRLFSLRRCSFNDI
jgi:hypothetical protein